MQEINKNMLRLKTDLQEAIKESVAKGYPNIWRRLALMTTPKIQLPNMFLTLDDLNKNTEKLLEPVIMTLVTNDLLGSDWKEDMLSEYYESLLGNQSFVITYALISCMSDFQLSSYLFYVNKEFIFNYLESAIVKPNLRTSLNNIHDSLNKKSKVDIEMEQADSLIKNINDCIFKLMIETDRKFVDLLDVIIRTEIDDKLEKIKVAMDNSEFFIPDFLKTMLLENKINDIEISRLDSFLQKYVITYSHDGILNLFKEYSSEDENMLLEKVHITMVKRNEFQGLINKPLIDGLRLNEILIADKIIHMIQLTDDEARIVEDNYILNNIYSIIRKYAVFDSKVEVKDHKLIIKGVSEDDPDKIYNIMRKTVVDEINDPFIVFKTPKWVKSTFKRDKSKSCLYQTGVLKKDESDMLLNGVKDEALRENSSPESKVIHRKRYINKLLGIVKDPEVLSKYKELTENRINKIQYLNPNKSTPYIEESPEKLLLILAETDALHQQILTDLASQDKYNKNRR